MSSVATVLILTGLALLFMKTGDLRFTAVRDFLSASGGQWGGESVIGVVLLLAGFAVKAGLAPFNGWVPDAYSDAPAPVSVLLAGIVTKVAGVYAILRLSGGIFSAMPWVRTVLLALGLLSVFVGALAALGQNDFKRVLAFSSISQVGYIILGAATGSLLGFAGALLHFFNHAVFKSLLFVNASAVEERTGTRDLRDLGGLASTMRITGGTSAVGFLSASGIPPLSGFWSKLFIIMALWTSGIVWAAAAALGASVLTLAYFLVLQRKVFFGKPAERLAGVREAGAHLTGPALVLAGITVAVGLLLPLAMSSLGWLLG
jgi:multicomponent Na+:H+ antiporter subunit D